MTNFERWISNFSINDLIEQIDVMGACFLCPAEYLCETKKDNFVSCSETIKEWGNIVEH